MTTVTGDLISGDCSVTLIVDPERLRQLDADALRVNLRLGRIMIGRLQAELDGVAAELARRETSSRIHPATAALDIEQVMQRTGMSKGWLYKQARKGALPFARRLGRRIVFDEAGLTRWLARRPRVA